MVLSFANVWSGKDPFTFSNFGGLAIPFDFGWSPSLHFVQGHGPEFLNNSYYFRSTTLGNQMNITYNPVLNSYSAYT